MAIPWREPPTLQIEQPVKCDFVMNLKSAKALGFTIPPAVLARADEVISDPTPSGSMRPAVGCRPGAAGSVALATS